MVIEDKAVTPNDLTTIEPFTPDYQQNNQALLHGTCDPQSITTSDEHNEHLRNDENSVFYEDDISTNLQKPNRKKGVTTAVMEGIYSTYVNVHN